MLDQPPPIHPLTDDISPSHHSNLIDLHRLPNGVRLRLALGTIINDLFARQTFHPPYRHTHPHQGGKHPHNTGHSEHSPVMASPSDLPNVLAPVSGAFVPRYQLQHLHHPTPTTSPMIHSPPYSDFQYSQSSPNLPGSGQTFNRSIHHHHHQRRQFSGAPTNAPKNSTSPAQTQAPQTAHLHFDALDIYTLVVRYVLRQSRLRGQRQQRAVLVEGQQQTVKAPLREVGRVISLLEVAH